MIEYSDIFLSDLFSNAYILLTTHHTLPLKNNHEKEQNKFKIDDSFFK